MASPLTPVGHMELQHATKVVSNQTLFSPDDLVYLQTHYIHTDHEQALHGFGKGRIPVDRHP